MSEPTPAVAVENLTTTTGWKYPLYDGQGRKKRIEPFDTDRALPAWKYDYDDAGEVTDAERVNLLVGGGESAPIASQTRGYAYDGVGNRETTTQGAGAEARTTDYHSNEHNQYANSGAVPAIAHHRYVEITGQAATGAVVQVKVNGEIGIPISGGNTDVRPGSVCDCLTAPRSSPVDAGLEVLDASARHAAAADDG